MADIEEAQRRLRRFIAQQEQEAEEQDQENEVQDTEEDETDGRNYKRNKKYHWNAKNVSTHSNCEVKHFPVI